MPFKFRDDIKFGKKGNDYYLIFNSGYWGTQLRFGDFTMATNLLYIAKKQLIKQYSFLTEDNFRFVFNNKGHVYISQLPRMLNIFRNLFYPDVANNIDSSKYGLQNIYPSGNLWQFKMYLDENRFRFDEDDYPNIIPEIDFNVINKNTVYILPVVGKKYNTERNWSFEFLINIINKVDINSKIKIIAIDNVKVDISTTQQILAQKNRNIKIVKKASWYDIINGICISGKEFISGDCGMSHFVSALPPTIRPKKIKCYYKTKGLNTKNKQIEQIITNNNLPEDVTFTPYGLYKGVNLKVLKF